MDLKHGEKVTLELLNWDGKWKKVEGKIVESAGLKFLEHQDKDFFGFRPLNADPNYLYCWCLGDVEGTNWRSIKPEKKGAER